jgi:hypothetical protein
LSRLAVSLSQIGRDAQAVETVNVGSLLNHLNTIANSGDGIGVFYTDIAIIMSYTPDATW